MELPSGVSSPAPPAGAPATVSDVAAASATIGVGGASASPVLPQPHQESSAHSFMEIIGERAGFSPATIRRSVAPSVMPGASGMPSASMAAEGLQADPTVPVVEPYVPPDVEDLRPVNPDFIDVFMPPVDMGRVDHIAFAYTYPPGADPAKVIRSLFRKRASILESL